MQDRSAEHGRTHEKRRRRAASTMLLPGSTPPPSRAIHSTSRMYRRWQGCGEGGSGGRGGQRAGRGRGRGRERAGSGLHPFRRRGRRVRCKAPRAARNSMGAPQLPQRSPCCRLPRADLPMLVLQLPHRNLHPLGRRLEELTRKLGVRLRTRAAARASSVRVV